MCVSLLERVKQGKSNIILILILSARSQDRDRKELDRTGIDEKFQSTRSQDRDISGAMSGLSGIYFNPLGRKTETLTALELFTELVFQSTRSQDRDEYHF